MSTAREIITGAFRLINLIQQNESPAAADIGYGLDALNAMLDSWSNERLGIYSVKPWYFKLEPQKQIYTLGDGGDWDVPRPMDIFQLYVSYGAVIFDGGWSPPDVLDLTWHLPPPSRSLVPTTSDAGLTLDLPVNPPPQYFTSIIYPILVTDAMSVGVPVFERGYTLITTVEAISLGVPTMQSGTLAATIEYLSYGPTIEAIALGVAVPQSGTLTVTIEYLSYGPTIEHIGLSIPTPQSGTLVVTIISYTIPVEHIALSIPTLQSGTLS